MTAVLCSGTPARASGFAALLAIAACADIVPGAEQFATASAACATPCDDGQPCTQDTCTAGKCVHVPLSGGRCLDGACAPTWIQAHGLCLADSAAMDVGAMGNLTHQSTLGSLPIYVLPPGNLLHNGGAEDGFEGWDVTNGGDGWEVSTAFLWGSKSFRSSYAWSSLGQTIDLVAAGYAPDSLDAGAPIYLSAFAGSTESTTLLDVFRLRVEFLDEAGGVLDTWASKTIVAATLEQPTRTWSAVSAGDKTCPKGTRKLRYVLEGRDGEGWAGHFGALHDGLSVAIGKLEMRFSNDAKTWSEWQAYAPVVPAWSLTPHPGPKTVYAQFRDEAGTTVGKTIEFSLYRLND